MIEALVLDFDGTILETETPDYRSWQETFESFGVRLDPSLWASYVGGGSGSFDVLAHLAELSGRAFDRGEVRARRRRRYMEMVEAEPLRPGVLDFIANAERLGLRLGVASSATRNWVVGHLRSRGLMGRFGMVRCAEDVRRIKPDQRSTWPSRRSWASRRAARSPLRTRRGAWRRPRARGCTA